MVFELSEDRGPGEELILKRWRSAGGRWWIDLEPMLYGVRVRFGRAGGPVYETDYCCGQSRVALVLLPAMIMRILRDLDELDTISVVSIDWPQQQAKPMANDPECWGRLCELAGVPCLPLEA